MKGDTKSLDHGSYTVISGVLGLLVNGSVSVHTSLIHWAEASS